MKVNEPLFSWISPRMNHQQTPIKAKCTHHQPMIKSNELLKKNRNVSVYKTFFCKAEFTGFKGWQHSAYRCRLYQNNWQIIFSYIFAFFTPVWTWRKNMLILLLFFCSEPNSPGYNGWQHPAYRCRLYFGAIFGFIFLSNYNDSIF